MACQNECFFITILAQAIAATNKNNHSQRGPKSSPKNTTAADETPVWIEIFHFKVIKVKTAANIKNINKILAKTIFPNRNDRMTPIEWTTKVNPYSLILCSCLVVSQSEISFVDKRCTKYINGINPSIKSNMNINRHLKPLNRLQPAATASIPGINHTGSKRREMMMANDFFTISQYYINSAKLLGAIDIKLWYNYKRR